MILFKQYCYTMKHSLISPQGSGSNIDLCVITADKTEYLRPFDVANLKGQRYLGTERCGSADLPSGKGSRPCDNE